MLKKLKKVLFLLTPIVVFASCLGKFVETDVNKTYAANETEIKDFAAKNSLTLTKEPVSGVYYKIDKTNPTGLVPSVLNEFYVAYKISTLEGKVIEEKLPKDSLVLNLGLNRVVFGGFIKALGLLKEGEKGQFFIPADLAYGTNPPSGVAINAVVILDLEAIDFYTEDERIDRYVKKKGYKKVEKTTTGLRFIRQNDRILTNDSLKNGDVVSVLYNGTLLNDVKFDSGTFPYTIGANNVVSGFSEGIGKLRKGEKAKIILPSKLGYDSKSPSASIPAYSLLLFDIEIVTVNGK
jgi:FKBP-type peptidyl-prolyl cis-trans isomerase